MPSVLQDFPERAIIGMVHVGALPGTPKSTQSIDALARAAAEESRVLERAGFDAVIIENMHDAPYVHGEALGPEIVAGMTRAAQAVADSINIPFGLQILSGGNTQALAAGIATGAQFIRCENFVFSHVADEGLLERAEAGTLLRYRRSIAAEQIRIFADIKKKHASHSLTADISIAEAAQAAEFFGADGVIVTGSATGTPTSPSDVAEVRQATRLPLLVGSGVTPKDVSVLLEHADAVIVGSWIKDAGHWKNPVDPDRAAELIRAARASG